MAMLAEPRKKTKYRVQPFSGFSKVNKRCDDDSGSAAFKMMSKMGWAPGKGLGVNESGNVDPIKLRLKNDDAGLGFKVSEDDALAQQSEFQALLLQLNSGANDSEIEVGDSKKKLKKPKIRSLEKQSEQSTKRVHYKKFTRGKDLSRASEQDLMSILGLSSKKPKVKEPEPELITPEPIEDTVTLHGVNMYVTAGSSVDYFKKKSLERKSNKQSATLDESTQPDSTEEESKNGDKNKRRSVTWGDVDVSYVDKYIKDMVDTSGSVDDSLNDSACIEPPAKKKKKRKNREATAEVPEIVIEEPVPVVDTEKKKKKKKKLGNDENSEENVTGNQENLIESVPVNTEKKKKKKRKLHEDENSKENIAEDQENHFEPKKKKKRKMNAVDQEIVSEANNFVDNDETEALIDSEEQNSNVQSTEEPKQIKKKKKKKRNQVDALPEPSE